MATETPETRVTSYESAKIDGDRLEADLLSAKVALKAIVNANGGPGNMGLTSDTVKAMPKWQDAKRRLDDLWNRYRDFNAKFASIFAKEIKADRANRARGTVAK